MEELSLNIRRDCATVQDSPSRTLELGEETDYVSL